MSNYNQLKLTYADGRQESITLTGNTIEQGEYQYRNIAAVEVPEIVEVIEDYAFCDQMGPGPCLNSIKLNEGLRYIGNQAFQHGTYSAITIPSTVGFIGMNAFNIAAEQAADEAGNLTVTCLATTPPEMYDYEEIIFGDPEKITAIYVPADSVDLYKAAEYWSNYAAKIQALPPNHIADIASAYIGDTLVDKIYLGDVLVYGGEEPDPRLSQPLTFNITRSGYVTFRKTGTALSALTIEYKKNDGEWISTAVTSTLNITVASGDTVQFRGNNPRYAANSGTSGYYVFGGPASFTAEGNIMSLISAENFANLTTLESAYTFNRLFYNCTGLTDVSNLVLPATTLTEGCYHYMFYQCINLTAAPEILPATTLAPSCYKFMFARCTKLTTTPSLPATALATECYYYMFGQSSLVTAPALPATNLAEGCYRSMFYNCTGLTTPPTTLPATTLSPMCYYTMFYNCTAMTSAPELPATTLANQCYSFMFENCTRLTTPPTTLPATTLDSGMTAVYAAMFRNCTSLRTAPEILLTEDNTIGTGNVYQNSTAQTDGNVTTSGVSTCNMMFQGCTSLTTPPSHLSVTYASPYCFQDMFSGCTSLTATPVFEIETLSSGSCKNMFEGCTSLTTVPQLTATTLDYACYENMFKWCTGLRATPEIVGLLPVTTLAKQCYAGMFSNCTSLAYGPTLPATTLAEGCYRYMFENCTSLISAPALFATTLAAHCYRAMFVGCTSLTTAPSILPATTLTPYCYQFMFSGCTSLTTAPELPATTLVSYCYSGMFGGCTSLNQITCLATNISASNSHYNWVAGVSATGTFYKNPDMASWTTGTSGIPNGWTVVDHGSEPVYSAMPLTFDIISAGTINWVASDSAGTRTIEYSLDGGESWNSITSTTEGGTEIQVSAGDRVQFRGDNANYGYIDENEDLFQTNTFENSTAEFIAKGNIMSLINSQNFENLTTLESGFTFIGLFNGCYGLRDASNLVLPATTLTEGCYSYMFYGCSSLTTAPELPATTLVEQCYKEMFGECTSLNQITCLATDISASDCTSFWIFYVSSTGTFYKNPDMASWTTGSDGIPDGWAVVDYYN